jgi:hypothetical protein
MVAGSGRNMEATMAMKDTPASRERRMRRAAARKGLVVRKLDHGKERGRFELRDLGGAPAASPDRAHPATFSLEEAESYIEASDGSARSA